MIATPIRISKIIIPKNRRKINEEVVKSLMESIETIGLLNPITTCNENILIAGLHRLEAFKRLGRKEIDCNRLGGNYLNYELAEIDENLIRNELSILERTDIIARRKELYEEMNPETKHGGDTGKNQYKEWQKPESVFSQKAPSFVESTSNLTGKSPSVIKEEIAISKNLTPEVKELIKDEPISDKKTELLKLSKQEPEIQKEIAEKLVNKEINKVDEYYNYELIDSKIKDSFKNEEEIDEREEKKRLKNKKIYNNSFTEEGIMILEEAKAKFENWGDKAVLDDNYINFVKDVNSNFKSILDNLKYIDKLSKK